MAYHYSALHNTILHDGNDDDALDERGLLKDGKRLSVRMTAMDHETVDASIAMEDARRQSAEDRALYNLDVSNRWRGGISAIQAGDVVKIGDQMRVVQSHDDGKLVFRDARTTTTDAEARQNMYDEYDNDIQTRYLTTNDAKAGDQCVTAGREKGIWRERADGRLACVPGGDKSSKENEIAGPVSDEQRVKVMDEAYASYDSEVSERWRR